MSTLCTRPSSGARATLRRRSLGIAAKSGRRHDKNMRFPGERRGGEIVATVGGYEGNEVHKRRNEANGDERRNARVHPPLVSLEGGMNPRIFFVCLRLLR